MKKIKYGNRDKTKQKKNPFIDGLKEDQDDVCGAVLDSFSNDYLNYISGLVKASKTPSKLRTQERIDQLFQNKDKIKQKINETKKNDTNVTVKSKSKQASPAKTPKIESDIKNSTVPIKNMRQLAQMNQTGYIRKQRQKSAGQALQNNTKIAHKNFNLKQHYNRFPTQEGQKNIKQQKFDLTSIACSNDEKSVQHSKSLKNTGTGRQFLQGLDEYLITLQSNRNFKKQTKSKPKFTFGDNSDLKQIQQLFQQNLKLRKKLKKYQQKALQLQEYMQNHFTYCKKQQKSNKLKINDLTKALLRTVSKINSQKQQMQQMKLQLKKFSRKAQFCAEKYDQESSDNQQIIHDSLMKVIRPLRAISQHKLRRKSNEFDYMNLIKNRE